ncbi:hypothetical protein CFP56_027055 [Quercus suber]|uniref:Uncharacterized protein n=1 Tax=Quercus suber TaxID=58331 RepID=A0AAW0JZ84_QUESU
MLVFGLVLVSQAIRAAQGLTSIQFSPTSEYFYLPMVNVMVLFLKALSMMGKQYYIFNTILEIPFMNFLLTATLLCWKISLLDSVLYRVSDMELRGSASKCRGLGLVNVACFHPFAGGGLFYGRKVWLGTFREVLVIISVDIIKIAFLPLNTGKGKPRVLQCDGARGVNCTGSNYIPEENMAFTHLFYRFTSPSAKANNDNNTDLFSSLISDIKSYSDNDPLLPWLRRKKVEFASKRFLAFFRGRRD